MILDTGEKEKQKLMESILMVMMMMTNLLLLLFLDSDDSVVSISAQLNYFSFHVIYSGILFVEMNGYNI